MTSAGLLLLAVAARAAEPAAPAAAPDAAPATAAAYFSAAIGRPAFDALRARGVIVTQGDQIEERLQFVHWKSLEQLSGLSTSIAHFADSLRALTAGQPAKAAPEDLDRLAALAPQGLMTPALHTAAQTLAALQRQLAALGAEGSAVAAVLAAQQPLFDTPWGLRLAAETRVDVADDPSGLVDRYFSDWLAGPSAEPAATAHFTAYAANKAPDAAPRLASDARAGRLSTELRRQLEKYLTDQRRLAELKRLNETLLKHLKQARVQKDLAALEAAAGGLGRPEVLRELESKPIPLNPAAPRPKLTSAGAHMWEPTRLNQYELGDEISVSGAYWVDGLKENESVEVEETLFALRPTGPEAIKVTRVKRANGGPYAYALKIPVLESRDFAFLSIVSAAGSNPLSERVTLPVARDFELALGKLAAADAAVSACRFDQAGYAALAAELAAPAKDKKQYEGLRKAAEARAKEAALAAKALGELENAIAASRADASDETCNYDVKRTAAALAAARKLPAGCDRFVPALERQLWDIRDRKDSQLAYERWSALARSQRNSCALASSAESAASALAVLGAEPAARCGVYKDDAEKLEQELLQTRAAESWRERLAADLASAQAAATPEARLAGARAVSARAASLPDSRCLAKERSGAETLAARSSLELEQSTSPVTGLPPDARSARLEAEITAERQARIKASQIETGKKAAEQVPQAAAPTGEPTTVPAPAAPVKTRSRLQCLEDGRRASAGALIDCEGKPFKIFELKRLRDAAETPKPKAKPATGSKTDAR